MAYVWIQYIQINGESTNPFFPSLNLPNHPEIETVSIPLPTGDIPSYTPMVVPPNN